MNNSISKALAGAGDSLDMDSRFEASDHSVLVLEFGFSLDLLLSLVLMGADVMLRVVMTVVLRGLFAGSFVDSYAMLFEHLPPDISHRSPFLQHYGSLTSAAWDLASSPAWFSDFSSFLTTLDRAVTPADSRLGCVGCWNKAVSQLGSSQLML